MCLGTLNEFQTRYEKPILEGQKYNCTKRQLAMSRKSKSHDGHMTSMVTVAFTCILYVSNYRT